jgi:hypothetical protein
MRLAWSRATPSADPRLTGTGAVETLRPARRLPSAEKIAQIRLSGLPWNGSSDAKSAP